MSESRTYQGCGVLTEMTYFVLIIAFHMNTSMCRQLFNMS